MSRRHLTGIAALLVVAFVALLGAGAVADIISPPGTVVNGGQIEGGVTNGPGTWPDAPDTQLSGAATLYSADFAADLNGWQAIPAAEGEQPASWRTLKGKLLQNGDHMGDSSEQEAVLVSGDAAWTSYTLQTQAYATSGSPFGLVWRAGKDGMYRVRLFQNLPNDKPKAHLELVTPDGLKLLAQAPVSVWPGYELAQWHTLRVTTDGAKQQVWVNGTQIFDVEDATLTSGQIGVYAIAEGAAAFDNVRVLAAAGAQ